MLTSGVTTNSTTFRRDAFKKWDKRNMTSRRRVKNLLVVLILTSAAVASYLVFYKHDSSLTSKMGWPGDVQNMHIDEDGHRRPDQGRFSAFQKNLQNRLSNLVQHKEEEEEDESKYEDLEKLNDLVKDKEDDDTRNEEGDENEELDDLQENIKVGQIPEKHLIRNQNGDIVGQRLFAHGVDKKRLEKGDLGDDHMPRPAPPPGADMSEEEGEEEEEEEEEIQQADPLQAPPFDDTLNAEEEEQEEQEGDGAGEEEKEDLLNPERGQVFGDEEEGGGVFHNLEKKMRDRIASRKKERLDVIDGGDVDDENEVPGAGAGVLGHPENLKNYRFDKDGAANVILPFDERSFNRKDEKEDETNNHRLGDLEEIDNRQPGAFMPQHNNGFGIGAFKPPKKEEDPDDAQKIAEGFAAFNLNNDIGNQGFGANKHDKKNRPKSKTVGKNGLLKGGGGPPIRMFGNHGVNPALEGGFGGVQINKKHDDLANGFDPLESHEKFQFDFRDKKKGLFDYSSYKKRPGQQNGQYGGNNFQEAPHAYVPKHPKIHKEPLGLLMDDVPDPDPVPSHVLPGQIPQQGAPKQFMPQANNAFPILPQGGQAAGNAQQLQQQQLQQLLQLQQQQQQLKGGGAAGNAEQLKLQQQQLQQLLALQQQQQQLQPQPQFPQQPMDGLLPEVQGGDGVIAASNPPTRQDSPFDTHPAQNQPLPPQYKKPVFPPVGLDPNAQDDGAGAQTPLEIRDVSKPVNYNFLCKQFEFPSGPGVLCMHREGQDPMSDEIASKGEWEPAMMKQLSAILDSDWMLGLVDIGAGIGVYSIAAALMHRKVVAVEPLNKNYLMLHKSAYENKVGNKIVLVTQALDNEKYVGQVDFEHDGYSNTHLKKMEKGMPVDQTTTVHVTTLDNLIQAVSFPRAVLKIDVTDNREASILSAGSTFFKVVDVRYVLTHWSTSSGKDHTGLMMALAKLGYAPSRTWNGPTLKLDHLKQDQTFLVWSKPKTTDTMHSGVTV
ncbi:uncharacterized protein LOC101854339 [Aplysia californica]|uniref:Uncharacterized protein LOC101854339 n=1 Tax=Aplysia californica TaxID=6500 RepID=A0ABM0JU39_APLCA|nr:uncharacterized protein LOC101854339 [Aplysia californica]